MTRRALRVLVLVPCLLATGCSAVEDAARDVASDSVEAGRDAAAREAERLLGGAADDALETALAQLPGTCADWAAAPVAVRTSAAELVVRAVLLRSGDTGAPSTEQVTGTSAAVDDRCADAGGSTPVRDVALDAAGDAGLPVAAATGGTDEATSGAGADSSAPVG